MKTQKQAHIADCTAHRRVRARARLMLLVPAAAAIFFCRLLPADPLPRKPIGKELLREESLQRDLARQLGKAAVPESDHPVVEIARQMQTVEGLLGQVQSGAGTQRMQAEILAGLDALIQQARTGAAQSKPSQAKSPGAAPRKPVSQPKSAKPGQKPGQKAGKAAKDSKSATGTPGSGRPDMQQVLSVLKQHWGELPENVREQVLQAMGTEEFLPKYELLIEEYYKRLAEEPSSGQR